ncbi:MAG: DNA mismatch endonuclease Vsr [Chloracidobacterium sp.]|nr:DNA mismatch endonuclease Vsr [Chloracidobacterium sp.]
MVDNITPKQRSSNMSRIRSVNTRPEVAARSLLHRLGYRFRKNVKSLPGKPDIVLKKHDTVIFVHGCFWHKHTGCKRSNMPKSNSGYWELKLLGNVSRDRKHIENLKALGWKVCVVWECEIKNADKLIKKIQRVLDK